MSFDDIIFQFIHNLAGKLALLDLLMVFLAKYLPYFFVIAFIFLIFYKKKWHERFYFILLSVLSLLLGRGLLLNIINFIYPRLRPFAALVFTPLINHSSNASFPSEHATVLFTLALIIFFLEKKWFWYFLIAAVLNSLARVYVGVHWPTDVVVGAILGTITVLLLRKLLPKIET